MANVNFDELFGNFTAADALAATEVKKTSGFSRDNLYKPSIKDEKCKDMNYRSLIRFIPYMKDGKAQTVVTRWECYLKDVNGNNGIFVVSPKTDGKRCPIRDLGWKLHTSQSAIDQKNSEKISVYSQYYALVEVINDTQHPEYNGKVMIYQFGQKIMDKITNAMKSTDYTTGINPFDIYNAPCFEINMTKDSKKTMGNGNPVSNYDACQFTNRMAPIHFNGEELVRTSESQHAFLDWLNDGAPKISDYFWKEWDQETTDKVYANLATYKSDYKAPRTTVAAAQEAVNIVTESPVKNTPKAEIEDLPEFPEDNTSSQEETQVSDNGADDAWIADILG